MFPIPRHLVSILKPIGEENSEFYVVGKIQCECCAEEFGVGIVGDESDYEVDKVIKVADVDGNSFLIVKLHCNSCNKEHLIFDNDYHGWNGFVCGGDSRELDRPQTKIWVCNKCKTANHNVTIFISSQGKADFEEGDREKFEKNDWKEAFEWITIKTECRNCGECNDEWISYETM